MKATKTGTGYLTRRLARLRGVQGIKWWDLLHPNSVHFNEHFRRVANGLQWLQVDVSASIKPLYLDLSIEIGLLKGTVQD